MVYDLLLAGIWGLGLATRMCSLQKVPLGNDANSWVLRQDGGLFHNGLEVARLSEPPQEGDIIVSWDFHFTSLAVGDRRM